MTNDLRKQVAGYRLKIGTVLLSVLFAVSYLLPVAVSAQQYSQSIGPNNVGGVQGNTSGLPTENINQPGFKLIVCDGPDLSGLINPIQMTLNGKATTTTPGKNPSGYVPCDFNGLMMQVQHLINVMLVLGVIVAIGGFMYAGYIYISAGMRGDSDAHGKALDVFKKIGYGFIIMLSAWFVVFQILAWLTGAGSGFGVLLGK